MITGAQTRREITLALWPPLSAYVHGAMRGSIAMALYLLGATLIAKIVAVWAVIALLAPVESNIVKALTDGIKRLWELRSSEY